jgi:hypothetical protein
METFLDINETKSIIEKLVMYNKSQQDNSEAIINSLNQIASSYNGKCNGVISSIHERVSNDMNMALASQNSDISYLRNLITGYETTVMQNVKILGGGR